MELNTIIANYNKLCKLYNRYKYAMKNILDNAYVLKPNHRLCELDNIVRSIEKYPISWDYYTSQQLRFSQEFEDLIIFTSSKISIN